MPLPLSGLLVVALEQAVAAPMWHLPARRRGRARDQGRAAGGRFARGYDKLARPRADGRERADAARADERERTSSDEGASSHEHGRERPASLTKTGVNALVFLTKTGVNALMPARAPISSGSTAASSRCALDLARDNDKGLLAAMLARADVFVQNLKPGAVAKLGFPLDAVAARRLRAW